MTSDDSRVSATRCAVPAFMRVEPAIGSAPVSSQIGWSASSSIGVFGLLAMPTVSAPRDAASRRQASVNGVVPLAATAISASLLADADAARRARRPRSASSSAPSTARSSASRPPAISSTRRARRPAEGRHQLGAVLHGEPSRRAGAGIDEPAAAAQPLLDGQRGAFERRARGVHGGDRGELALEHRVEDVRRAPTDRLPNSAGWVVRFPSISPSPGKRALPIAGSHRLSSSALQVRDSQEAVRRWAWRSEICVEAPRARCADRGRAACRAGRGAGRAAALLAARGRRHLRARQFGARGDLRQASDRAVSRRAGRGGGAEHRQRLSPQAASRRPAFLAVSQSGRSDDLVANAAMAREAGALTVGAGQRYARARSLRRAISCCRSAPDRSAASPRQRRLSPALPRCCGSSRIGPGTAPRRRASSRLPERLARRRRSRLERRDRPARRGAEPRRDRPRPDPGDRPRGGAEAEGGRQPARRGVQRRGIPARPGGAGRGPLPDPRADAVRCRRSPACGRWSTTSRQRARRCSRPACDGALPVLAPDHPETDAVCLIQAFYAMIVRLAARLGIDPDRPRHLQKVTSTR